MADLDTLRPEVREAVQELDGKAYPGSRTHECWQTIRAELLRLTESDTDLRGWINEVEQEAGRWQSRAERAKTELETIKARIAGAPVGVFGLCYNGHEPGFLGFPQAVDNLPRESMLGKCVRLVVEE